jgi:hypothetical protein
VFQERTVQTYVVDNFDGAVGFVVVGFDWRSRGQFNTPATRDSRSRFDPAAHYRPTSRNLTAVRNGWIALTVEQGGK